VFLLQQLRLEPLEPLEPLGQLVELVAQHHLPLFVVQQVVLVVEVLQTQPLSLVVQVELVLAAVLTLLAVVECQGHRQDQGLVVLGDHLTLAVAVKVMLKLAVLVTLDLLTVAVEVVQKQTVKLVE
jgi:hypothetical protein